MTVKINGYPIDVALSEELTADTEITKYPIERGSRNSDHMQNLPEILTFEGVVSDTPTGAIAVDATRQNIEGGALPSRDAYTRLIAIRDALEPVTIECSLGVFKDMGLTHLSVPRTRKTGKGLQFTVSFEKMKFVTNNRTTVKVAIPNGGPRQNLGNKESQEWARKYNLPGKRFVISHAVTARATLSKANTYGKPPLLTTSHIDRLSVNGTDDRFYDLDHYEVVGDTKPDGYVDSYYGKIDQAGVANNIFPAGKLVYHRFRATAGGTGFQGQTKPIEHSIDGQEVTFDENEKAWKNRDGRVVRQMKNKTRRNPEETKAYNDEKWHGVEYGSNLPGGGIQHP